MRKGRIKSCFCQIPLEKLIDLVRLRFMDGQETTELMNRLTSQKDREYLATVALLDVPEKDVVDMVEVDNPALMNHLLACRARTLEILEHYGFKSKKAVGKANKNEHL